MYVNSFQKFSLYLAGNLLFLKYSEETIYSEV
jgi:hypothetical protein